MKICECVSWSIMQGLVLREMPHQISHIVVQAPHAPLIACPLVLLPMKNWEVIISKYMSEMNGVHGFKLLFSGEPASSIQRVKA